MMHSEFTKHSDGSVTMINMLLSDSGAIVRREADMNAVVIQIVEAPQEDGTMEYRRVVSIVCRDNEMLETLRETAHFVLKELQTNSKG